LEEQLIEVPRYSKASLSSLLYQNFNELVQNIWKYSYFTLFFKDIPRINLCNGCFDEITKKQARRFDRAHVLLEDFLKQGVVDPTKEKSAETEYKNFEKTLHSMLEKQINQQNDVEQENSQLYSQLIKEISELCGLEDEAAELDYQNTVLEEEADKLNRELTIQTLEYKSLKNMDSFKKIFDIKVYEEFGVIRQYQIKFPPKPDFSSVNDDFRWLIRKIP